MKLYLKEGSISTVCGKIINNELNNENESSLEQYYSETKWQSMLWKTRLLLGEETLTKQAQFQGNVNCFL